jgi:hypothetical protein
MIKFTILFVAGLLILSGGISMIVSVLSAFGYFLYSWGGLGITVGASLWAGFKLGIYLWLGGLISAASGLLIAFITYPSSVKVKFNKL